MSEGKKNTIYFVDVTNRDGVQTSRLGLAKLEKTKAKIEAEIAEIPGLQKDILSTHEETG